MNSWGYANKIPTSVWRGSMTVPRYWCYIETSKPWFFKIGGFMTVPRYKWHRLGDSKSERLCSVHFLNFSGSWQWPRWLGPTWCWAALSSNLNPSPRWTNSCLFLWFITKHQRLSIILLDTTTSKDFQYPVLFVNTTLTQVDEEEAELFLTPGLTWTSSGNFAQAEVIISFLFVELLLSCGLGKSPRASIWWMLWIFLKIFIKL